VRCSLQAGDVRFIACGLWGGSAGFGDAGGTEAVNAFAR
jgi:hypothetical protein